MEDHKDRKESSSPIFTPSPIERIQQLETMILNIVMPKIAKLTHETHVQARIIKMLLETGKSPTQLELDVIVREEAQKVQQEMPYVNLIEMPKSKSVPIFTPGGVINVRKKE